MEVDNSIKIFILRGADIVMIGRHVDAEAGQIIRYMLDNFAGLGNFIDDARGPSDIAAMTVRNHNPHLCIPSISFRISSHSSTTRLKLPSDILMMQRTSLAKCSSS